MKPAVLVMWPIRPNAMAQLEATYELHHHYSTEDKEALLSRVDNDVQAVVTTGEIGVANAVVDRLPRLSIVSCFGVGVDAIDVKACSTRQIPVTNTPDVLSKDVADMGLGLTLMILRQMGAADRFVRAGKWASEAMDYGTCAAGKTMGIIGLGRIGQELAKRAQAVEMQVAYYSRRPVAGVDYPYYASASELAAAVDVLALCCPGGTATRHLVNGEVLEALGPSGYLVNIARGSVVDEEALVTALEQGGIAGAALDVFADEPHVPEQLIAMENVVLQPHRASATNETRDAMAQLVVDNLAAHFAGRPLLTPVS